MSMACAASVAATMRDMRTNHAATTAHMRKGGGVMFRVVDHPFNRAWYADLIGWVMANPPSFAIVERVS